MTKVVIAGGTGFIGSSLTKALLAKGDDVLVLARDVPKFEAAAKRSGSRARVAEWSLTAGPAREAWEREVVAADAVVNLAGAGVMDKAWSEERKRELFASRLDVTTALALALASKSEEARASAVFASASAVGYYGMREDDAVVDEDSPPGTDLLARVSVDWEAAARPAKDAGVRVVHPRFGIVLGKGGGALAEMARPYKLHAGGPLGSGQQWVSWIHERDVVQALELLLTSPSPRGPFNFAAPRPVTMNELARAIASALHTHALFRVPPFALKIALGSGRAEALLTGQRASSARLAAAGYAFAFPDVGPALEDLLGGS